MSETYFRRFSDLGQFLPCKASCLCSSPSRESHPVQTGLRVGFSTSLASICRKVQRSVLLREGAGRNLRTAGQKTGSAGGWSSPCGACILFWSLPLHFRSSASVFRSSGTSIGFAMWAFIPASSDFRLSSSKALAESAMIGISAVGYILRIAFVAS